ncbi:MAG: prolyl oligopeptidase family serine peptidase [Gemmataceae bacterium]|nr:prolyl oligopeptidase family serine peptidase [Gemmataceae bacterium]
MPARPAVLLAAVLTSGGLHPRLARADGPADNVPDKVRLIPPAGNDLPPAVEKEIRAGLKELQDLLKGLEKYEFYPDVAVYEKAVRWALDYKEVYDGKKDAPGATVRAVLKSGLERARQLTDGKHPWTTATGLVVRGYRSKIDGSYQPYGLVVPKSYDFEGDLPHRLDVWWHGRGETLSEANFIDQRSKSPGEFTPRGAFVLHPYGRYCNANKFAGEVDTLEAIGHASEHYRIDGDRLVARGFSMGGAACWQFAVHYPGLWCAAAPGAGFAETPEFLNVFQNEKADPPWYEQRLWRLYNATDSAVNIYNVPTVAYSGENDKQKQAADVMARELEKEKIALVHLIGPKTGHSYEKAAKDHLNGRIDALAGLGRMFTPERVRFATPTLRHNQSAWVRVDGLERHWQKGYVHAALRLSISDANGQSRPATVLETEGVTAITLQFRPGEFPDVLDGSALYIDGANVLQYAVTNSDRSLALSIRKVGGKWQQVASPKPDGLAKVHGLQGPIDDAFMDRFLMVKPTGKPLNEKVGGWAAGEMKHAVEHWRKQFRGDAPVKADTEVTKDDIDNANLVLWGDPSSNAVLAKIADKLPVKWTADGVTVGDQTYPAGTHVPVLIYPNPLNPAKYVVLNSGFTFREYDYLNNARQTPKLPDYAVLDVTTPPNSRYPGKVVRAGFFGEKWELLPDDGR